MNPRNEAMTEHRRFLWGLCYRMTGVAADADDLVQETFARALAHPPPRSDLPLRPWLARIAVNAARDQLRRRRRTAYDGPWLPSPVELDFDEDSERRYERLESASFAFLLALEALTPSQRAVLLLREVFDYSVEETAEALSLSVANVKTTHHRARKRMAVYEQDRARESAVERTSAAEQNLEVLGALMQALTSRDTSAVERLLAREVVLLNDGGGEFHAARVPVVGAARVALFLLRIQQLRGPPDAFALERLNGMPAVVAVWRNPRPGDAPRAVFRVELDREGRIREIHSILATRKLYAPKQPSHCLSTP